jgi:hypothetical protein
MISILESVIIPATKCLKCHHLGKPRFSVQGRRRNLPKSLDAGLRGDDVWMPALMAISTIMTQPLVRNDSKRNRI